MKVNRFAILEMSKIRKKKKKKKEGLKACEMSLEGKVVAQNALIAAALETARVVRLPCFWWLGQRSDPYIPVPGLFCSLFHYSHGHPEPGLAAQAACQPQGTAGPQFPNLQSHFAGL